jgi:hypothetical protein
MIEGFAGDEPTVPEESQSGATAESGSGPAGETDREETDE